MHLPRAHQKWPLEALDFLIDDSVITAMQLLCWFCCILFDNIIARASSLITHLPTDRLNSCRFPSYQTMHISKKRLIKAEGNKSLIDDKSNFVTQINELESLKKDGMEKKKGKNRDKKNSGGVAASIRWFHIRIIQNNSSSFSPQKSNFFDLLFSLLCSACSSPLSTPQNPSPQPGSSSH